MEVRVTFVRKLFRIVLWLMLAAIVLIAALGIALQEDAPDAPAPEPPAPRIDASAREFCRLVLRDVLNNPASAEWVDQPSWPATEVEPGRWLVRVTLRATNAFNALVLGSYECEARLADGNWTLIRLDPVDL
jgi:hypothetical protein